MQLMTANGRQLVHAMDIRMLLLQLVILDVWAS